MKLRNTYGIYASGEEYCGDIYMILDNATEQEAEEKCERLHKQYGKSIDFDYVLEND